MKICTDIKQSNELLKIGLSLETADMCWELDKNCSIEAYNLVPLIRYSVKERKELFEKDKELIPCWSLAALLELIPKKLDNYCFHISICPVTNKWQCYYYDGCFSSLYDNIIDSCVEMIVKLKEKNLL